MQLARYDEEVGDLLAVLRDRGRVRIDDHTPGAAVENQRDPIGQLPHQLLAHADHGRDSEAARHDRDVRRPRPRLGHEAGHALACHLRDLAGRQLLGDDDHPRGRVAQTLRLATHQRFEHAANDEADVAGALSDVRVVHRLEDLLKPPPLALDRPFGVQAEVPDVRLGRDDQRRIFQKEELRVEDRANEPRALDAAADLLELAAGLAKRASQSIDLAVDVLRGDLMFGNHDPLAAQDVRRTDRDSR